jgi:hypothetical protein
MATRSAPADPTPWCHSGVELDDRLFLAVQRDAIPSPRLTAAWLSPAAAISTSGSHPFPRR